MSHGNIGVFFSQCRVNDAELKNYRKQRQWNLGLEDNKKTGMLEGTIYCEERGN